MQCSGSMQQWLSVFTNFGLVLVAVTTLVSERETGTVDGRRYNIARSSVPGMIIVRLCRDAHRRA
ncbi:unnamed protein product [Trichogramma brassicae]|uniref:Uncharacterized protein n=1 Tax=Trichogramma brassicae TaxID=86971 RepID=A0A6H5J5J3_9HYME|nr:unnamed protein product [Trichogramma brassicae]